MVKRVNDASNFEMLQKLALAVLLGCILFTLPTLCNGQFEDPSFKYSREANENFDQKKPPIIYHHHDHDHDHDHVHDHEDYDDHDHYDEPIHQKSRIITIMHKNMPQIWLHAIVSTLLISAAPFVLLYIIPLDNSEAMKPRLKVLLAFASGGLLGDAFLHLIPHAAHPHTHSEHSHHDHPHHHDHHHEESHDAHSHGHDMTVGLWVLGGIIAFLSVEKLVRLLKGGHGHSHGGADKSKAKAKPKPKTKSSEKKAKSEDETGTEDVKPVEKSSKQKKPEKKEKSVIEEKDKEEEGEVEITGYLNLAADFAHNFTDGLAIGASYLAGNSIGIVTTVTILLHEVPHEIGDFAILIKSGCSRRTAILLQLVTALGAIAGTALALLGAGGSGDLSASWVLPFTAGGFIYIATVSVLPELLEETTKLGQSIKEIVALLAGVGLMVIIANFE